jgi:digeranylgeranylglycerophospholipid reductase
MDRCDVIVVGAGIVGSYFARRCAEGGLRVLLLDRRAREELGGWKNTGHNLDQRVFTELPLAAPSEDEIMARIDTAVFRPPVGEPFEFELPMISVRLKEFTARVLGEALDADVEFHDQTLVLGPIVEDHAVKGLVAECGGERREFRAALTVDVSGIEAVVRGALPAEFGFPAQLGRDDFLLVYGEDWEIGTEHHPRFTYHPKWQGWSGPRRPGVIGIGLGRFAARDEDPRELFAEFSREVWPAGGKRTWSTFNRVPLRHPLHSFVGNGVMMLGDSACQGKPLNGEGVSVMLLAAEIAQAVAARAVKSGDVSAAGLWDYNVRFQRDFGARFAPFHRLRYELLGFTATEQEHLFKMRMYGPEEISGIMGRVEMTMSLGRIPRLAASLARGASRPDLLLRLVRATLDGRRLMKLYQAYPWRPEELPGWAARVDELFHHR